MIYLYRKLLLYVLFPCLVFSLEKLDNIIAVIGDSIILSSELEAYTFLKINQLGLKPDSLEIDILRHKLLEEIVEGKVLLVHAEKDTNISLGDEEVDNELTNRITYILQQNKLNLTELDALLKKEQGMNLAAFRNEIRLQIRQELLKQKVQQFYISSDKINKKEVESFFNEYKDSLPILGESIRLQKISIDLTPSDEIKEKAYATISMVKKKLDNGEEFSKVATLYSEGPNAKGGGDLGYISKGTLNLLNFEEIIFSLKPGEISEPFATNIGFHIVNVIDRKDQQVHVKQIFVNFTLPDDHVQSIISTLDSIKTSSTTKEDFIHAVNQLSSDDVTKSRNGLLQWQVVTQLDPKIRTAFDTLTVGTISSPVKNKNNISLYRIFEMNKNRHLTLDDDWNEIAQIAQRIYTQKKLIDLVNKWRQEIFIDIRL